MNLGDGLQKGWVAEGGEIKQQDPGDSTQVLNDTDKNKYYHFTYHMR